MTKYTPNPLVNLQNETTAVANVNGNNTSISTAIENTLSRDGTSPNSMGAALDMNSNRILNLPAAVSSAEPVRLAEFQLGLPGPVGPPGANGTSSIYPATSTTSLLIAVGSKAFTTQAGLAYTAGTRVRAVSAANSANFMEGNVTSYIGTVLSVNVTKIGGSGTFADWNINIAGLPGVDGIGTGDVVGPASATDKAIARFNSTTGKLIQNSVVIADDAGNVSGIAALSPTTIELGHPSDTTLSRSSAGNMAIEGNVVYRVGGTDVAVADGGTGGSTVLAARTGIGVDGGTGIGDTNYTVLATDVLIWPTATLTANRTLTLPTVASVNLGQKITFNISTANSTGFVWILAGNGAETINGAGTFTFTPNLAFQEVTLKPIGSGQWVTTINGVTQGGTGKTSATAYAVQCGGTTSTGAFQDVSGVGTSGQVLTSNGAAALPTWQAAASSAFTTGDVKATYKTAADATWVMMDDGSIGNATSSATTRANADTSALYTLLWGIDTAVAKTCTISNASPAVITVAAGHTFNVNQRVIFTTTGALPTGLTAGTVYYIIAAGFTSTTFQVSLTVAGTAINTSSAGSGTHTVTGHFELGVQNSSGTLIARGANAAADFAANNRLLIPKVLGRAMAGAGAGSGLTSRNLGQTFGSETETQTAAKMVSHIHTFGGGARTPITDSPTGGFVGAAGGLQATAMDTTGGGVALDIIQPLFSANFMIKL